MKRIFRSVRFTLLLLICIQFTISADIALQDFVDTNNFQLYWDEILQRGIIWRGTELVSFMPNFPVASVNLKEFVAIEPAYYRGGSVYLPESTSGFLYNTLLPLSSTDIRSVSTIFIDPGHGGRDPGAIGKLATGEQIFEKDIVLEVAQHLAQLLRSTFPEKKIVISRNEDIYLKLEERTEMANTLAESSEDKVLFISIHVNAALNKQAQGIEVWYLPPEYRRQVIEPEQVRAESRSVVPILNSILEEEYTIESIILAQNIERAMIAELSDLTISRGLKEMDWYVVRRAFMPSVLIELGFISNAEEAERLNDPSYLQRLSRSIYNGLVNFVEDFENITY